MRLASFTRTLILAALLLTGCATRPIHPGAANTFDSDSFDALVVANSVIVNTKTDLTAGAFAPTLVPSIKAALNDLITAYDTADAAYLVYHAAAVAGTATVAQSNAVTSGLTQVNIATSALVTVKENK
jgi:hypothetical protein